MNKYRIWSVVILIIAVTIGYFAYTTENTDSRFALKYGLDLTGGTHLVYNADTSKLSPQEIDESMQSLRDVIERRVNVFGVSEPIVQVETGSALSGNQGDRRLIVELPGVTDIEEAVARIGQTPTLEFKLPIDISKFSEEELESLSEEELFENTGLTGSLVRRAQVTFESNNAGLSEPAVLLHFNDEGRELFSNLTGENVGVPLAIFLDGEIISAPVIRQQISDGTALISGGFTADEARELARDLNFGALPVPIELESTQSIGPTLGAEVLNSGIKAGIYGSILVALFMVIYYRLPGIISVVSLSLYALIVLSLFKLLSITVTAAGLAGFIISIGIAVDANVIIFERLKEELKKGNDRFSSIQTGFKRAWPAIRDSNLTSILSAIVLFYAGTFLTQSFALTLGLGVIISMLTAVTVTRTLLLSLERRRD
ncbi:MAG: protein translocase subunit SecD [Parcubacteria group bacterium CG11_big_fil_rev_8_21_14_0_20_39_22]|nr:MAG: protein translocase subunit SecD [Parcubacteria group bacterium CG11_big_fil_rev_8_21_14_0_20_39_22]